MLGNITHYLSVIKLLMRDSDNGNKLNATGMIHQNVLTPIHQMVMDNYTRCVGGSRFEIIECSQHQKYRSITGICNNFQEPIWGTSASPFRRLLSPVYEDGFVKPVGWFQHHQHNEHVKPNPRLVTKTLLSSSKITEDLLHNHMLMQFGQFLDHDIVFTALSKNINLLEDDYLDCRRTCIPVEPCFSLPRMDTKSKSKYQNEECIEMVRSAEYCGTGFTSVVFGKLSPREQMNQLTSFIDGSNIYGSTVELAHYLRKTNPDQGLLKTFTFNNRSYLPIDRELFFMDCNLSPSLNFTECFLAGDHRANEQVGLLAFHNLFVRHHNRLATKMR